jgi:hypothetical protein
MPGMMRRTLVTVVTVLIWLVAMASPASAHTVSGVGSTNWVTTLVGLKPAVPGITVRVVETGSLLELTNTGPELTVLGYEGEPYLQVGPGGVFRNTLSPATYLNCSRLGCAVPSSVNPLAPPQWQRISSGHTVRWHDHRTHWMAGSPPPYVLAAPNVVHQGPPWAVTLKQGATTISVTGRLTWVPGPSPIPWLLLAALLAALCVAIGLLGAWGAPLAAIVAILTVNDVYHAVGIAFSYSGGLTTRMYHLFTGSFYSIIGWVLGVLAIRLLLSRRIDGLYAAAFAGVSAALFTGLLDIGVVGHTIAPFDGPMTVDRITVALSLGLGFGVAAASVLALRRAPRPAWDEEHYDDDDEVDQAVSGSDPKR